MSAEGALVEEFKRMVLEVERLKGEVLSLKRQLVAIDQATVEGTRPAIDPLEAHRARSGLAYVVAEAVVPNVAEFATERFNRRTDGHAFVELVREPILEVAAKLCQSGVMQIREDNGRFVARVAAYRWPQNLPAMKELFG